jgi:hypothetical protein
MLSKELIEKAIDVFFEPEWDSFLSKQPEDIQDELSDLIFDLIFASGDKKQSPETEETDAV